MTYTLGSRSKESLSGVHPDLVDVVTKAIRNTDQDFSVIEGRRSKERQAKLLADGKSTTMNSRHLTGHAVDIVPYPVDWEDISRFEIVADAMKAAAIELDIPLVWGGDWKTFKDYPHYELNRKAYP